MKKAKVATENLLVHKVRLHPNNKQIGFFKQCSGIRRFAYNWALRQWDYERGYQKEYGGKSPSTYDIDKAFNKIKKEQFPWIYDVPSCVAQQAIKADLKSAYSHFFRRVKEGAKELGSPNRKRRKDGDSFQFTNTVINFNQINGNRLALPKGMGVVRMGEKIRFSGRIMSTTIKRSGDKWFAAFLIKTDEIPDYVQADPNKHIGIDVGIAKYASLSNGQSYDSTKEKMTLLRKRLARAQRKLSRMNGPDKRTKQKPSNGWIKQVEKVRSIHRKIVDFRNDYSDQISAELTKEFGVICMEDLKLKNMTASAKGDEKKPGKNVKAKSGLNRSMLDGGFYEFRRKIEYKTKRHNGVAVFVNPAYTSQKCSACNHIEKDNRKTQDSFKCVSCGFTANADINAAINIKNDGIISLSTQTLKVGPS